MGDIGNWEFAAAVAAVTLGLGGLLLFTVITGVGTWRMFGALAEAGRDSGRARVGPQAEGGEPKREVDALRVQLGTLAEQQTLLQEALRALSEAAQESDAREQRIRELDGIVRRLEVTVNEIAIAVADLNQRIG